MEPIRRQSFLGQGDLMILALPFSTFTTVVPRGPSTFTVVSLSKGSIFINLPFCSIKTAPPCFPAPGMIQKLANERTRRATIRALSEVVNRLRINEFWFRPGKLVVGGRGSKADVLSKVLYFASRFSLPSSYLPPSRGAMSLVLPWPPRAQICSSDLPRALKGKIISCLRSGT